MRHWGTNLNGVEYGNAWALRLKETPHTNWIVGDHPGIPSDCLRFLRHASSSQVGQLAEGLSLKWFAHDPDDPSAWGESKPISHGRTLSLLASAGAFELCLRRGGEELVLLLEAPGDFAVWGPGIAHGWRVLKPSLVMTLRWELVDEFEEKSGK